MKFSIRDLFWLTLLVACCVLWWLDRGRLNRLQEQVRQREQQEQLLSRTLIQTYAAQQRAAAAAANAAAMKSISELRLDGGAGDSHNPDQPPDMRFSAALFSFAIAPEASYRNRAGSTRIPKPNTPRLSDSDSLSTGEFGHVA